MLTSEMDRKWRASSLADNIYEKVDNIQSKMRMSPVADMTRVLLDTFLVRLEGITDDAEHCVKMFNAWKRMYRADPTNEG